MEGVSELEVYSDYIKGRMIKMVIIKKTITDARGTVKRKTFPSGVIVEEVTIPSASYLASLPSNPPSGNNPEMDALKSDIMAKLAAKGIVITLD